MMKDTVFTFLGSKFMDYSLQFENHQMGLIKNLYEKKMVEYKHVIMLAYVHDSIDYKAKLNVKSKIEKMKEIAAQYGFNLDFICAKGKTPISLFSTLKQIKKRISPFSKKIIFCQNYYSGYMGLHLKQSLSNVYLHTNFRGLPPEEELLYSESFFFKRILSYLTLKMIGRKIIIGSDSLSVVSEQYKKYLESKYKSGLKSIVVYPCTYNGSQFYTDESLRNIYRKKYRIQNHQKVLIYSGSMNKYQMPIDIFQFYENISKQDRAKNFVFFVLTFDKEKAKHLSKSFFIPNLFIKSAIGKDLLGIYNACDIGIICRKNDTVNRVASPTKIAEYLSTGNNVILTEGIGDYSNDLKDKQFAIVKRDIPAFLNTTLKELMGLRRPNDNDLAWVKSHYSKEKIKVFNEIFHISGFKFK